MPPGPAHADPASEPGDPVPSPDWMTAAEWEAAETIDDWAVSAIIDRMSRPDAASIFASDNPEVDLQALRDEAQSIRRNLEELAGDVAVNLIPRAAYLKAAEKANARLAEIDRAVIDGSRSHVASDLLMGSDVRAVWDKLDLSRQRAIIRSLMSVTISPVGRGCRNPDPERVFAIDWAA
jgi:site-specific DNA recombinase